MAKILDTLASELTYAWEKRVDQVRLRSRVYSNDRPAEVPERVLAPWRARVAKNGAPTLDNLAELAAALTDRQTRGMQEYWSWYLEGTGVAPPGGPSGFHGARHHLRLWAALSPAQRTAAKGRQIVPVGGMSVLQRQAFFTGLTAPEEMPFRTGGLDRQPAPEELAAGGFSLSAQELRQQAYRGGGPEGDRRVMVLQGVGANTPPPELPGGVQFEPAGPPALLDGYVFSYYLGGEQAPVRIASLNVARR